MIDSEILSRYYTYNALYYFFNDKTAVAEGVLAGLNPNEIEKVLDDPYLGMSKMEGLLHWIEASKT